MALVVLTPSLDAAAQTLTIVAPAAPGGGWDQTARVIQRVLLEIEPGASVHVENVPGAAGTIGLARFVQSERGNPHALLVTGLVMVSSVVINHSPVMLADVIPIARLTGEYEVIVVPTSSPYRSLGDLLAAFRSDPGRVAWGGGSAGGTDDLLIRLVADQLGLAASRVNYVAFSGGGAALGAVLGGQVTAGVSGYSEFAGPIDAGQLRVLAVSAPRRLAGINAPTLREAGVALDLANWRALVAPPGLSDAERVALIQRVTTVAQSQPWKTALEQNGWSDLFLPGQDFRQFLLAEHARVEAVLQRLASADASRPAGLSLALTPTTLPTFLVTVFAGSVVALIARVRGRFAFALPEKPATMRVCVALLALPVLLPLAGFVLSSTALFTVVAQALDPNRHEGSRGNLALNVALGFAFAAALFLIFGRGLGVVLPSTPGLRGWL
ncbi:MAG: tripartite tricarboxylate transporter substrate binding protein [Vicinamibacterales bacterium]